MEVMCHCVLWSQHNLGSICLQTPWCILFRGVSGLKFSNMEMTCVFPLYSREPCSAPKFSGQCLWKFQARESLETDTKPLTFAVLEHKERMIPIQPKSVRLGQTPSQPCCQEEVGAPAPGGGNRRTEGTHKKT